MEFKYLGTDAGGQVLKGVIEADTELEAKRILHNNGVTITSLDKSFSIDTIEINFGTGVSSKDIVLLSRQLASLFNAQISALRVFALLSEESDNTKLQAVLYQIVTDLESGSTLSAALEKHPKIFTPFYVNMVVSGEETGRLPQTFEYLADYLERNYELTSKAKSALTYPAFVISTFFGVMILMLTYIIPKVGVILVESGQELPTYTKIVLGVSSFLINYGFVLLAILILAIGVAIYLFKQPGGKKAFANFALHVPYLGEMYRKIYLSRFSDNMYTMLDSGISMIRALEITQAVIGNRIYESILEDAIEHVRAGKPLSESLSNYPDYIPSVLIQMVRVGEETGRIGDILKTLSDYYTREVKNAVDALVSLIEPAMIVFLGLGVGTLLASVLMPIYNISTGI